MHSTTMSNSTCPIQFQNKLEYEYFSLNLKLYMYKWHNEEFEFSCINSTFNIHVQIILDSLFITYVHDLKLYLCASDTNLLNFYTLACVITISDASTFNIKFIP